MLRTLKFPLIWLLSVILVTTTGSVVALSQTNVENIYSILSRSTEIEKKSGYTIKEIVNDYALRHTAPSVDFQSINFPSGSAVIPESERWKVEPLAEVIHKFIHTNSSERFLIEGHTDTVGKFDENLKLSLARADAVTTLLTHDHLVPAFAITPVGFGYTDLAINTKGPNPRNRRVTLRRITDLMVPFELKQSTTPQNELSLTDTPEQKSQNTYQSKTKDNSQLDL